MEFLDEDARPRFLFQSKPQPSSSPEESSPKTSKALLFISLSASAVLLSLSLFYFQVEPVQSLLIWISLSLFLGPFAPVSITGGDIRVGRGTVIPDLPDQDPQSDSETRRNPRRSKAERKDELRIKNEAFSNGSFNLEGKGENANGFSNSGGKSEIWRKIEDVRINNSAAIVNGGEKEWNEEDLEILKKQMMKNPPGKPGRWEAVAAAFKGRHSLESVIKKSKDLGEKKLDDSDSYAQFLKNRKPSKAKEEAKDEATENIEIKKENGDDNVGMGWTSGEDIALLNALKAFPKEAPMRWEKIAAAVPGRSKAACMKRVADLKKDFRSSKASEK